MHAIKRKKKRIDFLNFDIDVKGERGGIAECKNASHAHLQSSGGCWIGFLKCR